MLPTVCASTGAVVAALGHALAGRTSRWDGLLIATAAEAGGTAVLTEDLADKAVQTGVQVINPFSGSRLSASADRLLQVAP